LQQGKSCWIVTSAIYWSERYFKQEQTQVHRSFSPVIFKTDWKMSFHERFFSRPIACIGLAAWGWTANLIGTRNNYFWLDWRQKPKTKTTIQTA